MSRGKKGFTLSEVLIATVLFGVCIIFVAQLMTQSLRSFKKYRAEANAKRQNDAIINQISAEARTAFVIELADPQEFVFLRYVSDGTIYRVIYYYDPGTKELERSWELYSNDSVNGTDIIGTNVESCNFKYYNDINDPTLIALVRPLVGTGQDEVQGATKEYLGQTKSKRRIVKRADQASVTTE